jgi:hypothetical protein
MVKKINSMKHNEAVEGSGMTVLSMVLDLFF